MRFNIRTKIILTVSLSLILIFAVIMYLLVTRNVSQLRANLNTSSKSFAALATPPIGNTFLLYQHSGSIRITQQVDKFLALDSDIEAIQIVSVTGKQLYSSKASATPPVDAALAASFKPQYVTDKRGYVRGVIQPFFEDSGAHRYAVVYQVSTDRVQRSINGVVRPLLYVGVAILAISIAITTWLLNSLFIRPLRDVSRSANRISSGDFSQQIVPKNKDEIGDLAVSVNKMAESLKGDIVKLQGLDKLKSEFLMIASHNLRTPLTVMRGYIEMAEQAETAQELKAIIKTVEESVVRLHLLSEDLLTISTLEAGGEMLRKSPVEAKGFIDVSVSEFALLAEKKRLHWQFTNDVPAGVKLEISQSNVRSALANLLDNAIKFTKEGGSVAVTAVLNGEWLVFSVRDTGIGISTEEMPKLFTMFHRGTGTMHYDYEGAGIGLYLTKLIVEKHDGHIEVKSQAGQGSIFTVSLPLAPSAGSSSPSAPVDRRHGA